MIVGSVSIFCCQPLEHPFCSDLHCLLIPIMVHDIGSVGPAVMSFCSVVVIILGLNANILTERYCARICLHCQHAMNSFQFDGTRVVSLMS